MNKLLLAAGTMLAVTMILFLSQMGHNKQNVAYDLNVHPIDNMPLVDDDPFAAAAHGGAPSIRIFSNFPRRSFYQRQSNPF